MSAESENTSAFGMRSGIGWPIGSALGGALGAAALGVLLWLGDPSIIESTIPSFYGVDPAGVVGWGIHLAHGVVLGLVFGFLLTREPILGVVRTNAETEAISQTGLAARVVGAGVAFGIGVWAILPLLILPAVGGDAVNEFPSLAVDGLIGHVLFGLILGLVFALTIDLRNRSAESPLEE